MKRLLLLVSFGLVTAAAALAASTHYVRPSETCTNTVLQSPYTNWNTAATQIQWAVNVAANNDTVLVSNGVYDTGGVIGCRVYVSGKTGLVLKAVSANPADTVIVGQPDSAINFFGTNSLRCVVLEGINTVRGFTLRNGYTGSNASGGGVYAYLGSGSIISNCYIVNCAANRLGGGICYGNIFNCVISNNWVSGVDANGGSGGGAGIATLTDCVIANNNATTGTWVLAGGGTYNSALSNCVIRGNKAGNSGGGMLFGWAVNCLIANNRTLTAGEGNNGAGVSAISALDRCTIISNTCAGYGGAINFSPSATIKNCLIVRNTAAEYAAIYDNSSTRTNLFIINCTIAENITTDAGYAAISGYNLNFVNCIIWSNTAGGTILNWSATPSGTKFAFCDVGSPVPTGVNDIGGNINQNPNFIAQGNFGLANASRCINTGTNQAWMPSAMDIANKRRIRMFNVDMGAYEYQQNLSMVGNIITNIGGKSVLNIIGYR